MVWPNFLRRGGDASGLSCAGCGDDFLLITWDSCRFDAFQAASTPNLNAFGHARRAWAMATYTLPAHIAMFHGFLPHVFESEPFYNRHCRQLWRITHRNVHQPPLVSFPPGTRNVPAGFAAAGYHTVGVAAMSMFRHAPELRKGFGQFTVTREQDARRQNQLLIESISKAKQTAAFAFVNYGETHSPFHHEDMPDFDPQVEETFSLGRLFNQHGTRQNNWTFNQPAFDRQVACCEFLDARTGELLNFFQQRGRPTTVVLCGDHGECFGENGLYGHAFYHEKVMEVPLLIFRLNAPPHALPEQAHRAAAHCQYA